MAGKGGKNEGEEMLERERRKEKLREEETN